VSTKPFPQALWLVDDAVEDDVTGKITLKGICEILDILAPATEYTEGAALFFAMRNIHGELRVILDYRDLAQDQSLVTATIRLQADSPNETVSRSFRVNNIPVPHDGRYAWQLRWNDEVIAEAPITAYITPQKPG
jgi:hypothetical protein